jgi:hypothetical protein
VDNVKRVAIACVRDNRCTTAQQLVRAAVLDVGHQLHELDAARMLRQHDRLLRVEPVERSNVAREKLVFAAEVMLQPSDKAVFSTGRSHVSTAADV